MLHKRIKRMIRIHYKLIDNTYMAAQTGTEVEYIKQKLDQGKVNDYFLMLVDDWA